ncbi:acetyl-CoA hydrolase [Parahaliea sp. F7430]|uniref:Acetyl-CoA hydrolase n=1 Tax=Sediminihaliea albiluteola TaxID=2758564 RepID=A0A7W2YIB7_9GAMM|nr:acetyl-CoA hydrolase/transferase C-terminal domain-containing protein [Sediminihaliea albiluteola]MBA6412341.1 acetyl-CoA hydrolase [Sediminihaliea albiluteola]
MSEIMASVADCVERTIARVGKQIVLAAPLGLGKPVALINAFYERAASDPSISLHILTALSLERPPRPKGVAGPLVGPILERIFEDYEELAYMAPLRAGKLPANIQVSEFYFRAGALKGVPVAQRNYISSNYTHAARDLVGQGVNVIAQLVAGREGELSLSCNPDLTLRMAELLKDAEHPVMFLAQLHPELPFMGHDAAVKPEFFDLLLDSPQYNQRLFSVPNVPIPQADYAAALHASTLVVDGGTLQIGIGALGDAVAQACILRHHNNAAYRSMLKAIDTPPVAIEQHYDDFDLGLYVSTEMFVNGMLELIKAGVITRKVYDQLQLQQGLNEGLISEAIDERMLNYCREQGLLPRQLDQSALTELQYWGIFSEQLSLNQAGELLLAGQPLSNDMDEPETRKALLAATQGQSLRHGCLLHGGFFLGPKAFYEYLRNMPEAEAEQICMTGVERTNQLLENVPLYSAQRRRARFINTGMIVSLDGSVASDALEDGTVISGVGGQYNFVSMAHDMPDARSILCIRATRGQGKALKSNILPNYGHTTIPRHLRDVIVTEYGIADLRGQSNAEVVKRLLCVADSRFQDQLLKAALDSGSVEPGYEIPEAYRNNTPQRLAEILAPFYQQGLLPDYPFGSDLTPEEQRLVETLRVLESNMGHWRSALSLLWSAWREPAPAAEVKPFLVRLELDQPSSWRDRIMAKLVAKQLQRSALHE